MTQRLARFGIRAGRRVDLALAGGAIAISVPGATATRGTDFAARALQRLGWGDICYRVQACEALSPDDVVRLLQDAPFAVLLKLVELRASRNEYRADAPLFLPFQGQNKQ